MRKLAILFVLVAVSCGKDDKPSVGGNNSANNNAPDMSSMPDMAGTSDMSTGSPDTDGTSDMTSTPDVSATDMATDLGVDAAAPDLGVDMAPDMAVAPCGNGILDPGENCDPGIAMGPGACPSTCDDGVPCTTDTLMGNATDCSATCGTTPICADGDSCCAMGCTIANDSECFMPAGTSLGATDFNGTLNVSVNQIAMAPGDGYFLGGIFQGPLVLTSLVTLNPVNSFTAAWVGEFASNGDLVWAKTLDSDLADAITGMAYDAATDTLKVAVAPRGTSIDLGGMVLPLNGNLDFVVASLDASNDGAVLWAKAYGDASAQIPYSLALAPDGSVWVSGGFQGTVDFGGGALTSAGAFDAMLLHLDANGGYLGGYQWGGMGDDVVRAASVFPDNSVVATGTFQATANFGGTDKTSINSVDLYVVRLDSAGNHAWSVAYGGPAYQASSDIAVLQNGDVAVVGGFQNSINFGPGMMMPSAGNYDAFAAILDGSNGVAKRAAKAGGPGSDQAVAVVASYAGINIIGYVEAGATDFFGNALPLYGAEDIFVARLTPMASTSWISTFGGVANDRGLDIALGAGYSVQTVGSYEGPVDFGSGAMPYIAGEEGSYASFAP